MRWSGTTRALFWCDISIDVSEGSRRPALGARDDGRAGAPGSGNGLRVPKAELRNRESWGESEVLIIRTDVFSRRTPLKLNTRLSTNRAYLELGEGRGGRRRGYYVGEPCRRMDRTMRWCVANLGRVSYVGTFGEDTKPLQLNFFRVGAQSLAQTSSQPVAYPQPNTPPQIFFLFLPASTMTRGSAPSSSDHYSRPGLPQET